MQPSGTVSTGSRRGSETPADADPGALGGGPAPYAACCDHRRRFWGGGCRRKAGPADHDRRRWRSHRLVAGRGGRPAPRCMARHSLVRDFRQIDPSTARIILLARVESILAPCRPQLSVHATEELRRRRVEVRTRRVVTAIDPRVEYVGEERIPARHVLRAAEPPSRRPEDCNSTATLPDPRGLSCTCWLWSASATALQCSWRGPGRI